MKLGKLPSPLFNSSFEHYTDLTQIQHCNGTHRTVQK